MSGQIDFLAAWAALGDLLSPFVATGVGLGAWALFKIEKRLSKLEWEKDHGTEENSKRRAA